MQVYTSLDVIGLFGPVLFVPNKLRPTAEFACQTIDSIPPVASTKLSLKPLY